MHSLEEIFPVHVRNQPRVLRRCLRYELLLRYGLAIYGMKLARVRRVDSPEGRYYVKTRRIRTGIVVELANVFLRRTDTVIHGLGLTDWLWWECHAGPLVHGRHPHVSGRSLCLPELPGIRLSEFLESTAELYLRLGAVRTAARELRRLHQMELLWPDGVRRSFSHGDAHSANVLFNTAHGTVLWFDFEAVHVASLSEAARRADDFRTLLFSAARDFTHRELPDLVAVIGGECEDDTVRRELGRQAARLARRPTGFHLAQCRLDWGKHQECCEVIHDVFAD